jgi:hypothetical protein
MKTISSPELLRDILTIDGIGRDRKQAALIELLDRAARQAGADLDSRGPGGPATAEVIADAFNRALGLSK